MQAIPTGTTGTLPILFETNGVTQAVTKFNGEALTVADVPGTGVVQLWFEQFLINMYGEEACYLLGGLVQACYKRKG